MSCRWSIMCLDCEKHYEYHVFENANHQIDFMRFIIKHADKLAGLAGMFKTCPYEIKIESSCGLIDPVWFDKHLNHQLVPCDEYGRVDGDCAEYFKCSEGESHTCRLPKDHDPPHSSKRSDTKI